MESRSRTRRRWSMLGRVICLRADKRDTNMGLFPPVDKSYKTIMRCHDSKTVKV